MSAEGAQAMAAPLAGVVVIVLLDYLRQHQAWGWFRLASGPPSARHHPGLLFAKIMGSGHGGGFTLRPSASHQGLLAVFDQFSHARDFIQSQYVQDARARTRSSWVGAMAVDSVRGSWDGCPWGVTPAESSFASSEPRLGAHPQRLAVLTRASIRPAKAMAFWRYAPSAQADLNQAPGCEIAMGLGEAPLIRQCTFSLWQSQQHMLAYAHDGAHRAAIEAANRSGFFHESLFVRMRLLGMSGHWNGQDFGHQAQILEAAHG